MGGGYVQSLRDNQQAVGSKRKKVILYRNPWLTCKHFFNRLLWILKIYTETRGSRTCYQKPTGHRNCLRLFKSLYDTQLQPVCEFRDTICLFSYTFTNLFTFDHFSDREHWPKQTAKHACAHVLQKMKLQAYLQVFLLIYSNIPYFHYQNYYPKWQTNIMDKNCIDFYISNCFRSNCN